MVNKLIIYTSKQKKKRNLNTKDLWFIRTSDDDDDDYDDDGVN